MSGLHQLSLKFSWSDQKISNKTLLISPMSLIGYLVIQLDDLSPLSIRSVLEIRTFFLVPSVFVLQRASFTCWCPLTGKSLFPMITWQVDGRYFNIRKSDENIEYQKVNMLELEKLYTTHPIIPSRTY